MIKTHSLLWSFRILMGLYISTTLWGAVLAAPSNTSMAAVQKEALQAYKSREYTKASKLFKQLYRETKKPIYLFNHGLCEYLSQNTEPARSALEEFIRIGAPGSTKDKAQSLLEQLGKAVSDEKVEVVVKSEPSGANVFLDERSGGMLGQTPFTLRLKPGSYVLIVDKAGFESTNRPVVVAEGARRELNFQLFPTDQMGAVKFLISEIDADVMVNKRRVGRSPMRELVRLPQGPHEIIVMKPGYSTWRKRVTVTSGKTNELQVDLILEGALLAGGSGKGLSKQVLPLSTVGAGLLLAGGAAFLGLQAQSLHDELESRSSQGVLAHPSDKETGKTWVMWTNVLATLGGGAILGGATWWYLNSTSDSAEPSGEIGFEARQNPFVVSW